MLQFTAAVYGEQELGGATQIRVDVIRPEVIVPRVSHRTDQADREVEDTEVLATSLRRGILVKVIREPWFGSKTFS